MSPDFHIWKGKVREKLFINKDWFPIGDKQVVYIKSWFKGKVESYFYIYLDAIEVEKKSN